MAGIELKNTIPEQSKRTEFNPLAEDDLVLCTRDLFAPADEEISASQQNPGSDLVVEKA